jgi:hypothetical protein
VAVEREDPCLCGRRTGLDSVQELGILQHRAQKKPDRRVEVVVDGGGILGRESLKREVTVDFVRA